MHRCFPMNFVELLRTPFFNETTPDDRFCIAEKVQNVNLKNTSMVFLSEKVRQNPGKPAKSLRRARLSVEWVKQLVIGKTMGKKNLLLIPKTIVNTRALVTFDNDLADIFTHIL